MFRQGFRKSSSLAFTVSLAGLAVVAVMAAAPAQAKVPAQDSLSRTTDSATSDATTGSMNPATLRMRLADNVVVTPGNQTAPAQPPAQTVVVPQGSAQAVPAQTVVEEPARRTNVHAEVSSPHNYMSTIAVSAIMGGVAGALVGGAIYYLGDRDNGVRIGYWAAGGVLLGTGIGITQVMVQESRVSSATAWKLPSDPAPTYRLALMRVNF